MLEYFLLCTVVKADQQSLGKPDASQSPQEEQSLLGFLNDAGGFLSNVVWDVFLLLLKSIMISFSFFVLKSP